MTPSRTELSHQYCICSVGSTGLAIPAISVREITSRPAIFAVPASPPLLLGLCHLRNEFLPVIGLSYVFGESLEDDSKRESLIVVNSMDGAWAFTIDRAYAVEPLETAHAAETQGEDDFSSIVTGTATFRDEVVRVLDADALFRSTAAALRDEWQRN